MKEYLATRHDPTSDSSSRYDKKQKADAVNAGLGLNKLEACRIVCTTMRRASGSVHRGQRRARMLVSFFLRGCPAMAETLRCSVSDCEESAAGSLDGCSFCREHFIFTCYEQLDQCRNWQEARLSPDRTSESVRQFLVECYRQLAQLAGNIKEFTGLERAQLIDILLRATDLSRQLRQSPRLAASIPVELRCEEPGGAWKEG